ncbi:MAG: hypothetical protein NT132_08380 [Microbacterium sp.]|uniref:hypothetical protein n=1 Tax=Microbacterium sp. TaxID=51671 RepID=UPI00262AA309|nr:hypothetical protein [Microbacterium sp.]MCX6502403.1 hypothetical protein [Microbacterium sp.]
MTAASDATCSRAGCRAPATWAVQWRNPRIHDAARRKTWLACDEHLTFLRDYLTNRAFPVEVLPMSEIGDRAR